MRTFDHFGIPVTSPVAGELYNEDLHLYYTDVAASPNKIEFLRFMPECPFHELIKTTAHIAYSVPSVEEAIVGAKVLYGPFTPVEGMTVAFIEEEGIPIELNHIEK
ncbi:MAG: hypothetical protein SNI87_06775 [Rikenellaceae bacterium]